VHQEGNTTPNFATRGQRKGKEGASGRGRGKGKIKSKGKGKGKGKSKGKGKGDKADASMLLAAALGGDSEAYYQLVGGSADLSSISMEELAELTSELEQKLGFIRGLANAKTKVSQLSNRAGLHLRRLDHTLWDIDTLAQKFHEHMSDSLGKIGLLQREYEKYVRNQNVRQLQRLWERCVQFATSHIALLGPLASDRRQLQQTLNQRSLGVRFEQRCERFCVCAVLPGGWGAQQGVVVGDVVVGINEHQLADIYQGDAADLSAWILGLSPPVAVFFNGRRFIQPAAASAHAQQGRTNTANAEAPSRKRRRNQEGHRT
jgi:hypothetical protein